MEVRGQIDGIGTSPRFSASDGAGDRLADERMDRRASTRRRRARCACRLASLALRRRARVLGVGHRVVHGGARYARPTIVTPEVLADLRALVPLAPLHQPYNLAAIDAVSERLPGVPQVACFDTSFHRGQPAVAEVGAAASRTLSRRRAALWIPRAFVRVHRVGSADRRAGDRPRSRHRRASRQRRQPLRDERRQERGQHARVHRARRTLHGDAAGRDRPGRDSVSFPEAGPLRQGSRDRSSTRSRVCSAFPASATTCAICSAAASPAHGSPSTISSTRRPNRSAHWRPCWAASTAWSSPPASARTPPRSAGGSVEASAWLGIDLDEEANVSKGPRISRDGKPRFGLGHPDKRRTDHRPAHRACCWGSSKPCI